MSSGNLPANIRCGSAVSREKPFASQYRGSASAPSTTPRQMRYPIVYSLERFTAFRPTDDRGRFPASCKE